MSETSNNQGFPHKYEALDFEKLGRRDHYRIIAYREDILHIVDKKENAATVYQIIYRWLDRRRVKLLVEIERRQAAAAPPLTDAEIEDYMWVYMSYHDFVVETGGALGYNTIGRALHYLIYDKKIIQRRRNHNPHFRDLEYRIDKDVVARLLGALPPTPFISPRGAKSHITPQESDGQISSCCSADEADNQFETPSSHNETGRPHNGTVMTQNETARPQIETVAPHNEACTDPDGAISQVTTQITTQVHPQQQQQLHHAGAAAAASIDFEIIDNKAPTLADQQQSGQASSDVSGAGSGRESLLAAPDEQAGGDEQAREQPEMAGKEAKLTAEHVVQLFEEKRGVPYDGLMRERQLQAASSILSLPLDRRRLEQMYDECYDNWWRKHFGSLHVHHLAETEWSSGQQRASRLLQRVLEREQHDGPPEETKPGGERSSGGWERFKQGSNQDDNLDYLVQWYHDRGLLES